PPYSSEPDAVRANQYIDMRQVAGSGYLIVLADHDTDDWSRPGVAHIVQAATPSAGHGAVVMMHDGGGDRSETVAALDQLLTRLSGRGYRFTTISAGLGLGPPAPATTGMRIRGEAMRWAQWFGNLLAKAMIVLLATAIVLGLLRLVLQLAAG